MEVERGGGKKSIRIEFMHCSAKIGSLGFLVSYNAAVSNLRELLRESSPLKAAATFSTSSNDLDAICNLGIVSGLPIAYLTAGDFWAEPIPVPVSSR